MANVTCPHCDSLLKTSEEPGENVRCSKCGNTFDVPEEEVVETFPYFETGQVERKNYDSHRSFLSAITFATWVHIFFVVIAPFVLFAVGAIAASISPLLVLFAIGAFTFVALFIWLLWTALRIIIELLIDIAENTSRKG